MATPVWNARHSGLFGDASAMANANDVNQLLGTHAQNEIYQGAAILTPTGSGTGIQQPLLSALNIDQPFTLSGTVVSRIEVPVLPTGNGADLLVSLCANNSGVPGTLVNSTRIPAAWIAQLAAADGLDAAGAVATAATNSLFYSGWESIAWATPVAGPTGNLNTAQLAQSGDYFIFAGGINQSTGVPIASVFIITWTGGSTISAPTAGTALPQPLLSGGCTVTSDTLCYVGGVTGASYTIQSTVYLASWDPGTGVIGTWSAQTNYPTNIANPGIASYAPTDTVYVVGGTTNYAPATAVTSSVYYATITSGQISGWTAGPALPVATGDPSVAVVGNFLVVAGGFNGVGDGNPGIYYSAINTATGALGPWISGPALPSGLYVEGVPAYTDNGIIWLQTLSTSTSLPVQDVLTLSWTPSGPGSWTHQVTPLVAVSEDPVAAIVSLGDGVYQAFNFVGTTYITVGVLTVPQISVPIPTTGLTTSTTYHVLLQQIGGDENNYLNTFLDNLVFSGNPTALSSTRNAFAWVAESPTGTAVPLTVYNNTTPPPGVLPLHTWEDNGLRIVSLVSNTTPDLALIGICEATAMVTAANANTGAATTLTPWAPTGGTLARSQTQVFEGLWSFQLTPSGSATVAYMQSELLNCLPGQSITISGWVWCTSAVTTNFSMSINWYTSGDVYINTSSNNISIPAATWTFVTNTFTATTSGGGGYRYTLNPALSGTPAASNVVYLSLVIGYPTFGGQQLSGVAQIDYPVSTWPEINPTKPTGATVLA